LALSGSYFFVVANKIYNHMHILKDVHQPVQFNANFDNLMEKTITTENLPKKKY